MCNSEIKENEKHKLIIIINFVLTEFITRFKAMNRRLSDVIKIGIASNNQQTIAFPFEHTRGFLI
jgi:hypothetical protein